MTQLAPKSLLVISTNGNNSECKTILATLLFPVFEVSEIPANAPTAKASGLEPTIEMSKGFPAG